jgi:predicted AlkP superfamily pyrophosphatase or phosphodiesterase
VLAFSEYGITEVRGFVALNRVLRQEGWLRVRFDPPVGELPLFGTSRAFAVCDHQIAHVYVAEPSDVQRVRERLEALDGVDRVLDREGKRAHGLDHPSSGELVAIAERDRWFAYPYWLDDSLAPDFARTVDIHRKPGYDPAELLLDPALRAPRARIAATLVKKKLGFRTLLRVIPLDPSPVRGSHGRLPDEPSRGPVVLGTPGIERISPSSLTALRAAIARHATEL